MHPLLLVGGIYGVVSAVTFGLYLFDKRAARSGQRRISESTLHLWEMLGGWPGAFFAQRQLRHKCAKPTYQIAFWSIVALHLAAWVTVWWFSSSR